LLLGGDYMFLDATRAKRDRLRAWIAATEVQTVIAVVGNHDLWGEEEKILTTLRDAGVHLLINESTRLPPPFHSVAVVGLDDPMTGVVHAERAFAGAQGAEVTIVLCHEPDGLLHCDGINFDLYLCGHTHGGQVSTPWGPITLPPGELHSEYYAGFHRHHERHLFVSRGVGGAEVPVRLYAPPDVLVIDVVPHQLEPSRAAAAAILTQRP
jgi:predicted MPP superfamily phosphohydrolase